MNKGSLAPPVPTAPLDDPWAELERLARAVPADKRVWWQFSSDTQTGEGVELSELLCYFDDEGAPRVWDWPVTGKFIAAANPATILKLIEAARQGPARYEGPTGRSHPNPSPSPEPVKDQAEQGVEPVAWATDRELAEVASDRSPLGRHLTIYRHAASGAHKPLYSQATVSALQKREAGLMALSDPAHWRDRDDQWSEAIKAVHPMNSDDPKRHERFMTALEMVGNRHGKYELVGLVQWLLTRAETAEALGDQT